MCFLRKYEKPAVPQKLAKHEWTRFILCYFLTSHNFFIFRGINVWIHFKKLENLKINRSAPFFEVFICLWSGFLVALWFERLIWCFVIGNIPRKTFKLKARVSYGCQRDRSKNFNKCQLFDFWLRQELKESQSLSVTSVTTCIDQSIFIFLAQIIKQTSIWI